MIQYYFEKVKRANKRKTGGCIHTGVLGEGGFNGCLERLNVHLEGENGSPHSDKSSAG